MRTLAELVLPEPARLRAALMLARLAKPVSGLFDVFPRFKAMLDLAPNRLPAREPLGEPGVKRPAGELRGRVILLAGCAQSVLDPAINAATVRLLNRLGIEVVIPAKAGCCGALTHHLGQEAGGRKRARALIDAWTEAERQGAVDAIVINTSGCGTMVKDYGHMFAHDPAYREEAARIAGLAKDISEYLQVLGFQAQAPERLRVAYHSACSMQHGQKISREPKMLLARAGFEVVEPAEGHLCCGSAGTYNILQPEIAAQLKERKLRNIKATRPQVIATGNIGCMTQIASGTALPVVHTVELLDWATGGPRPFQ
jgi:glycolate dehydrogenase iron-sulfur subunit